MNLEFTVTETVTSYNNKIDKIEYEFEEITTEVVSFGITNKKERRSRTYDTNIKREKYNQLAKQIPGALTFDHFIVVLRPFIMGYYQNNELEVAFQVLDEDHSGYIQIDELSNFLSIINEYVTADLLKDYIKKVDINTNGSLNYDQFRTLILKGIGRDIICNHI